MKELMLTIAIAAALASASFADRTADEIKAEWTTNELWKLSASDATRKAFVDAITETEWRAILDNIVDAGTANPLPEGAVRNIAVLSLAHIRNFDTLRALENSRFSSLSSEYDAKIAPIGWTSYIHDVTKWPKCNDGFIARAKIRELRPVCARLYDEAKAAGKPYLTVKGLSFADKFAFYLSEIVVAAYAPEVGDIVNPSLADLARRKNLVKEGVTMVLKRKFREKGKSFVEKDGVNPLEKPITDFTTALDAPRFAGLVAWMEEWCPEAKASAERMIAALPDAATVADLKDKIFFGEKDFTGKDQATLMMCLGVDGYNAFVKEYNEGAESSAEGK